MSDPKPGPMVAEVVEWFIATDTNTTSAHNKKESARVLRLFCRFTHQGRQMGGTLSDDCAGQDATAFLDATLDGCSPWTRRRFLSTIKRAFNAAARLAMIARNPFADVQEAKGERGRAITWDELRALLRVASPAARRIIMAVRLTGCSPGELRCLRWADVDVGHRKISVRRHATATATARTVKLTEQMARLLSWLHRRRYAGEPFVFLNARGGQWNDNALGRYLRTIRNRADLAPDVRLYGCTYLHRSDKKAQKAAAKAQARRQVRVHRHRERRERAERPAGMSTDERLGMLVARIGSLATPIVAERASVVDPPAEPVTPAIEAPARRMQIPIDRRGMGCGA